MRVKKNYLLVTTLIIACSILFSLVYGLSFTTKGSAFIAGLVLTKYIPSQHIEFEGVKGTLREQLSYKNIVFNDLKSLPRGTILKIQKLDITLRSFSPAGINIRIDNAMLAVPDFDPVLFYGSLEEGNLDINIYSKSVGIREALDWLTRDSSGKKISGTITDLDAYVKGAVFAPELQGTFRIDELKRNGFAVTNSPGSFNLRLEDVKGKFKLFGTVMFNSGTISGAKTARININESKILFNGLPRKPSLDLKGVSTVEGTKISITLKGAFEAPQLKLTSNPPLPQERLLIMLATGKTWKGAEESLSRGEISANLAKDFVDYFLFSGTGSKLAQRLGISGLSLTLEKDKKGVGIKGAVSEKIDASYAVEQTQAKEAEPGITQKIGGEYKITDSISIGAEKELKQDNKEGTAEEKQKTDDKVILEYKKGF